MPLVTMFYDDKVLIDEHLAVIMPVVQKELSAMLNLRLGTELDPADILVRPIPHHKWALRKRVLEVIVSLRAPSSGLGMSPDLLAEEIGHHLGLEIRSELRFEEDLPAPSTHPWACFVQIHVHEIGYSEFRAEP